MFEVPSHRKDTARYCSRKCRFTHQRPWNWNRQQVNCLICGTSISVKPSKAGSTKYCSRKCRNVADSRKKPPNYKGPQRTDRGYIVVDHPDGGRVYEHRLVMEQTLGRPLRRDEHVHHIDHDRSNNDPSNLQVMLCSDHMAFHHGSLDKPRDPLTGRFTSHSLNQ
jgi:hypothetical protein